MAHQGTFVENGMTYNVTEFDHTAQEIDDAVSNLGGASTPQGAIAALGAGVRDNLFVNPFFLVNQKNQDSYTGDTIGVDGWHITGGSTITVDADGITYAVPSSDSARRYLGQMFEQNLLGKQATLTFYTQDRQLYTGTGFFPASIGTYTDVFTIPNVGALRLNAQNNRGQEAYIIVNQGAQIAIRAAKLELGPDQTLCYKDSAGVWQLLEHPDPLEILKCKRYMIGLSGNSGADPVGFGSAISTTSARIFIPTLVPMRIKPTAVFDVSAWNLRQGSQYITPTAVTVQTISSTGITLNFTASGLTNGAALELRTNEANAVGILDANLL